MDEMNALMVKIGRGIISPGKDDCRLRQPAHNRLSSVASFLQVLIESSSHVAAFPYKLIWKSLAAPKFGPLTWLSALEKPKTL